MTAPAIVAGGRQARWTREAVIEKIQEWARLHGEPPRAADWNPSAAKWAGAEWRIARYRAGDWPSLNSAKGCFGGSFTAAVVAAGFEPTRPGPPSRRAVAAPNVRRDLHMTPAARAMLTDAEARAREAEERLEVRERQLDGARSSRDRMQRERDAARARSRRPAPPKTKTRTKVVRERVEDPRLLRRVESLEGRLEQAKANERGERDRRRSAERDAARSASEAAAARLANEEAIEARDVADRARKAAEDRATAAEALARREKVVVREVEVRSAEDAEVEDARRAVGRAEADVRSAELRAARAERQQRELAATVTGQDRMLTPEEVAELRAGGPSGPAVLAAAFRDLAEARAKGGQVRGALTRVASAAIRWRDAAR